MPKHCLEETVLWGHQWCYQRRGPDTVPQGDQTFISTGAWWPMNKSGILGGDPASPSFFNDNMIGLGSGRYAAWECGLGGSQTRKFIMGQCKQASGDPYPGARVYGYRTSDGRPIGYIDADDKGRYELGCPDTPSDAHFLVARASGSPEYVGVTVNNLLPTWRDGT